MNKSKEKPLLEIFKPDKERWQLPLNWVPSGRTEQSFASAEVFRPLIA